MYRYKTIIFDLDRTLFKTDTVFIKAINEVRKAHGLDLINNEEVIGFIGETSASICRKICGENISEKEIELIMREYHDIEKKLIDDSSMLYDGVKHMLESLTKDGYSLCICTNGSRQYVDSILKKFEIGEYFKVLKPQVKGLKKFQLIKQILDESACSSAIVVGDTHFDIEAANETGCLSIGVSYGYGGDDYKDADFIADSPMEICKIVKKINGLYKDLYIENYDPKKKSDIIIYNEDYLNPKIIKGYSNNKNTDRIKLEKIEKKHLSEIWTMLEDEEAAEMVGVISFPEEKDYEDKNSICYAILGEQKEFVGIVELFDISWKNRRAELSITIKASNRGQGYGYEAIKKMLKAGFEEHGLMRIWLRVLETNEKAISLYKKVGFAEEGICRCESLRKGKFINQIQMSILAPEWIETL